MRKRVTVLAALFVGLLGVPLASSSGAQARCFAGHPNLEGQFGLELAGGVAVPLGQLGDETMLTTRPGDAAIDTHRGRNGHVGADFYMTSFLSAGLWMGQNTLDMRDQWLPGADGLSVSESQLVRTTTTMFGLRVKGYVPMQGAWSPYGAMGVTHYNRKAEISHVLNPVDPAHPIYDMVDDRMGFDLGAGFEYRASSVVGMGVGATYFYSGAFAHDVPWMGRERVLHNWEFWTIEARLTLHVPGMNPR